MKNIEKRLKKLQQQQAADHARRRPEFICWTGNPWTEAEKTLVLKNHPDSNRFYKGVLTNLPLYKPHADGRPLLRLPDGSHYIPSRRKPRRPKG